MEMMDISAVRQIGATRPTSGKNAAKPAVSFEASMAATQKTDRSQDSITLSGGSYEQRLAKLQELHKRTDYSGMDDYEKVRIIDARFEEAFPDLRAMYGGLYLCAGENSIYTKIKDENSRQIQDAVGGELKFSSEKERLNYLQYICGYDGLTDDEMVARINEKYSGGTLADRSGALWELSSLGLIDSHAAGAMQREMRYSMIDATEGRYGHLWRDNPVRVNAMIEYASGARMNWTQLARATMITASNGTYEQLGKSNEEVKRQYLEELQGSLDEFLDRMLHTERKS